MTDHVAKAQEFAAKAENPDARRTLTCSGLAQAHALLALVEQQRLANLIEVAKWNSDALRRGTARKVGDEPVDFEAEIARVDAIFAEVQQGLGLS